MKSLIIVFCLLCFTNVYSEVTFDYGEEKCSFSGYYYEITDQTIMAYNENFTKRDYIVYYSVELDCKKNGEKTGNTGAICSKGAIGSFEPLRCLKSDFVYPHAFNKTPTMFILVSNRNIDSSNGLCFVSKYTDKLADFNFCKPLNKKDCPVYSRCNDKLISVRKLKY
jgi:hypothetical protein